MFIIGLLLGFGIGGLFEYFWSRRELRNSNTKVGTPSASNNSSMPKLPRVESCLDGIAGTNKWCAHHEWVLGAEAMHEYVSRQLRQ